MNKIVKIKRALGLVTSGSSGYDIIDHSTSIYSFESGKCGKERKKLRKFDYPENEKSFLDEIKNIFHSFWKSKNLIKIADTSFNEGFLISVNKQDGSII